MPKVGPSRDMSSVPRLTPRSKKRFICFDLEGPLSPQDNAYELMKLFPRGDAIFEALSRYDDLLALEGRPGYEPGDTLALIVPFLVYHGLTEADIIKLADRAGLTPGAKGLVSRLGSEGWQVFCISTSYHQYAYRIAERVGIPGERVACTSLELDRFREILCQEDLRLLPEIEEYIVAPPGEAELKRRLDRFYWEELPATKLGSVVAEVKPRGGSRKVTALSEFGRAYGLSWADWVVVGDSITDFKMLEAVEGAGGLAIAFNANEYALPYATLGLASTSLEDLWPVLEAWEAGGRSGAQGITIEKEAKGGNGDRNHFHWLSGADWHKAVAAHKRLRRLVREEAARLG
ncbi:MAG TPA: hypothetical protein G4O03_05970 [Dehalococcoidia bacterium]|nr:hypothetical protein [Dehalococcoidia bacterium]